METSAYKIIIWGAGMEYHKHFNQIQFEVAKNNIEVVGIIVKEKHQKKIDGAEVFALSELGCIKWDYILVTGIRYYEEIMQEAKAAGIGRNQLIHCRVLDIPYFDFKDYCRIREHPVSLFTQNCLGGLLYHYLDLELASPFINTLMSSADFLHLCADLRYYVSQPLAMEFEGSLFSEPKGSLGTGEKKIWIRFIHHFDFKSAKADFDRRRGRINWDNCLCLKVTNNEREVEEFSQLYSNRSLIISGCPGIEDLDKRIWEMKIWEIDYKNKSMNNIRLKRSFPEYQLNLDNWMRDCNIFKLLLEKEYVCRNS